MSIPSEHEIKFFALLSLYTLHCQTILKSKLGNLGQLFLCVLLIPMTIWLAEYVRLFYEILFSVFEFPIPAQWRIIVPIIAGSLFAELNCLGLVTVYSK